MTLAEMTCAGAEAAGNIKSVILLMMRGNQGRILPATEAPEELHELSSVQINFLKLPLPNHLPASA
jgi:hypothetical protein